MLHQSYRSAFFRFICNQTQKATMAKSRKIMNISLGNLPDKYSPYPQSVHNGEG